MRARKKNVGIEGRKNATEEERTWIINIGLQRVEEREGTKSPSPSNMDPTWRLSRTHACDFAFSTRMTLVSSVDCCIHELESV